MENKQHLPLRHRSNRPPQGTTNMGPSDNKVPETTSSSSHQSPAIGSTSQPDPAAFSIPMLNPSSFNLITDLCSFDVIANLSSSEGNPEANNPHETKEEKGTGGASHYLNTIANMFSAGTPAGMARRALTTSGPLGALIAFIASAPINKPTENSSSASSHSTASSSSSGFFSRLPSILTSRRLDTAPLEDKKGTNNGATQINANQSTPLSSSNPPNPHLILPMLVEPLVAWHMSRTSNSETASFNTEQTQRSSNDIPQDLSIDTNPQQAEGMPDPAINTPPTQHIAGHWELTADWIVAPNIRRDIRTPPLLRLNSTAASTQSTGTQDQWDQDLDAIYGDDREDAPQFSR